MPSHGDDDCAAIMSMFAAIDATVNATFNLQQDGDGDGSHGQPHQKLPKSKRRKFGVALNHHLQWLYQDASNSGSGIMPTIDS